MEYQIMKVLWSVEGKDSVALSNALEKYVNEAIAEGWEPLGGVGVESWQDGVNLYQAMTRKPKKF